MRAVIQRIRSGRVTVGAEVVGRSGPGLLVYLAVAAGDLDADADYIVDKVAGLRVFPDADGKMNLDVSQAGGSVLLVSAFTVLADARRGRRPSFDEAARGDAAKLQVDAVAHALRARGLAVETGRFAAEMLVEAVNDGPICIVLDSRRVV